MRGDTNYPGDIRWIGFGVRVSSFHVSKNARLVGPLGPGLRLVGRLRSGIMASASFQILFQGLISQRMFSQVISWKMTLQRWQRCLVTDLAETLGFQCTYLYLNAQKSLGSLYGAPQTSGCRVLSLSDCNYSLNPLSQTRIDQVGLDRIRSAFKLNCNLVCGNYQAYCCIQNIY